MDKILAPMMEFAIIMVFFAFPGGKNSIFIFRWKNISISNITAKSTDDRFSKNLSLEMHQNAGADDWPNVYKKSRIVTTTFVTVSLIWKTKSNATWTVYGNSADRLSKWDIWRQSMQLNETKLGRKKWKSRPRQGMKSSQVSSIEVKRWFSNLLALSY